VSLMWLAGVSLFTTRDQPRKDCDYYMASLSTPFFLKSSCAFLKPGPARLVLLLRF
jgi:hypothetical protein